MPVLLMPSIPSNSTCVLTQAVLFYNSKTPKSEKKKLPRFYLRAAPERRTHHSRTDRSRVSRGVMFCAKYFSGVGNATGSGKLSLVTVEIRLQTGWKYEEDTVDGNGKEKIYETNFDREGNFGELFILDLEFDTKVCWRMTMAQKYKVRHAHPSQVRVYDYFDRDVSAEASFSLVEEQGYYDKVKQVQKRDSGAEMIQPELTIVIFLLTLLRFSL